jgi:6-phosphogluconolactonase (cycloisomerase 2 family)
MRMKFNKSRQLVLVSAASLLGATLITACSQFTQTLTVDFVFVVSSKAAGSNQYGNIDVFEINSESGAMRQIPSSPFPSGGRNPVAEAVSSDSSNLFVANEYDNTVVQLTIGSDGKLYPYYTVNTPGIYPMALAATKTNLFVVDTYEPVPSCSTFSPCPGSVTVYPVNAATSTAPITLGAPLANSAVNGAYWPLSLTGSNDVIVPTGINVAASGAYLYVTAYDSSVTPSKGYIFAYAIGTNGALAAVPGSPFAAGTQPSAIASDSTSSHIYVTDFRNAAVLGYSVGANGALTGLTSGLGGTNRFQAGNQPASIVVDQSFPFAYVANSLDSTVTAYSIGNGALTSVGTYAAGQQPVAIGIDPSTQHFVYAANYLGGTVSGWELSETAGTLLVSQGAPFLSDAQPTAVAAISHNGTGAGIH